MGKPLILILSCVIFLASCVKEEGKVARANNAGGDTGTTSGTSGGSTPTPGAEDPLASQAWHLNNTGQTAFSSGAGLAGHDINANEAIEEGFTGKGVRIAVSDSGTDIDHEDLNANQLTGEHRNYALSNSLLWRGSNPTPQGDDAHGTAVAGLAAAVGWNGLGSRGVAPEAKFAGFRYIVDYNVSYESYLARSLDQTDGNFDIFNYSYGYGQCHFIEEDALLLEAFTDGVKNLRNGKGAIYVQSAGNDFAGTIARCRGDSTPGNFTGNTNHSDDLAIAEKVIVAAVNANGASSSYSSPGSGIWVSAPGGEYGDTSPAMITTDISGCNHGYSYSSWSLNTFNRGNAQNPNCSYTSYMNGTSSAAPVTSGVIALMLEANPALSWRDVKHILAMTSDKVNFSLTPVSHPLNNGIYGHVYDWKWIENANGIEYSNWYGFGRVNALQAVLAANTYDFPLGAYEKTSHPTSDEWYYDSGVISVTIPDHHGLPLTDPVEATSEIEVSHNFFIEAVQVQVTIDHDSPKDLSLILVSPAGTESRLLHLNNGVYATEMHANKLLLSNAFYTEESLGTWTLKLVDGTAGNEGILENWKIRIHGHRVSGDGTYPNAPTNLSASSSYPSLYDSPPVTFNLSNSVDVVRYEMSIGTAPGLDNKASWTSIGLNHTSVQLHQLQLNHNTSYYMNIRAIDNRENASSVATRIWNVN